MPLNGFVDLHSRIWFLLHLLPSASVALGKLTGETHHAFQTHHGVGEDWAVTSAYLPTKPSAMRVLAEWESWCTDTQSQLTKRECSQQRAQLLLVLLLLIILQFEYVF